jgi:hypothetical protein
MAVAAITVAPTAIAVRADTASTAPRFKGDASTEPCAEHRASYADATRER